MKSIIQDEFEFLSTPSARRATIFRSSHAPPAWISIHALREEGDTSSVMRCLRFRLFLSTPSARRATAVRLDIIGTVGISIHALREEGDKALTEYKDQQTQFLSTPSARRATYS